MLQLKQRSVLALPTYVRWRKYRCPLSKFLFGAASPMRFQAAFTLPNLAGIHNLDNLSGLQVYPEVRPYYHQHAQVNNAVQL